jgi:hypothetical protein
MLVLATRIALTIWENIWVIYEKHKGRQICWVTTVHLLTGTTFARSNQTVIKSDLFGINTLKSTHNTLESKMASSTTLDILAFLFAAASSFTLQGHDSSKYSSHVSLNNVQSMSIFKHYSYIFVMTVISLFRDSLVCQKTSLRWNYYIKVKCLACKLLFKEPHFSKDISQMRVFTNMHASVFFILIYFIKSIAANWEERN